MSTLHSTFWSEQPEPDDPYTAEAAYCHGYDVYGDMLGQARWADMLYLLLRGAAPTSAQAALLETLAVALANPGPRDGAVHAAMCGGSCGSTAAASLMAALAVGAGQSGGAREVFLCMQDWDACSTELARWRSPAPALAPVAGGDGSIWPAPPHRPGFEARRKSAATPVRQTLACLARYGEATRLAWLAQHREELENATGHGLALTGVAAAALCDLGFSAAQGEMLYLLLRLPGAAAHALEQAGFGHKKFPFGNIVLENQEDAA